MSDVSGSMLPDGASASLGRQLRAARKSSGLTQPQLAELAGVSERTLRDIERGRGSASLAAVVAVAEVLGLTLRAER